MTLNEILNAVLILSAIHGKRARVEYVNGEFVVTPMVSQ